MFNFLKYLFAKKLQDFSWFEVMKCRWNGHKCGVFWYSNGLEPDIICKNCGDDLG